MNKTMSGFEFGNYDEEVDGEVETLDKWTYGDFDDEETFGGPKKFKKPNVKQMKGRMNQPIKAAQAGFRSPMRTISRSIPKQIRQPMAKLIPSSVNQSVQKARSTVSQLPQQASRNAQIAVAMMMKRKKIDNEQTNSNNSSEIVESNMNKSSAPGQVVKVSGGQLTARDVTPGAQRKAGRVAAQHQHPMMAMVAPMGSDGAMGFDIRAMMRDLDQKRLETQKTLITKTVAQAKTAGGNYFSSAATRLSTDPAVRALAIEEATTAATSATAASINKFLANKPAQIMLGIAAVASLGYYSWKKKQGA